MSIASEITRIQTAKENIRTSIINKGGTLSSNAPIDEYASAISSIPTSVPVTESLSITENGTYDVTEYASAVVDVAQKITPDGLADDSQEYGDMVLTVPRITRARVFSGAKIDSVTAKNCVFVADYCFAGAMQIKHIDFPALKEVGLYGFNTIGISSAVLPSLVTANTGMFANSPNLKDIRIGKDIQTIGDRFVINSQVGWTVKIKGTPTFIHEGAFRLGGAGDIYVPWSEGEVANAPWSATNATIHYNTVYDENWNVISSS